MRKTCLNEVYELAKEDPRIVFVGSDLGVGVLSEFKDEMPDRFFMEGVAEANVIGLAAGLALEGFIPYVNTIATFLTRRCFEQIAVDLCLQNLPVRLIGNGGGVVYAPLGPTHLATEDLAIMRALPNMTVLSPSDAEEMKRLVPATVDLAGPAYIRLGKGGDPVVSDPDKGFNIGRGIMLRETKGAKVLMVASGVMSGRALDAAALLPFDVDVLHLHTIKPIDSAQLIARAAQADLVVTVEEHVRCGGLGSAVLEVLADAGQRALVKRLSLPDAFPAKYGSQDSLLEHYGLHPEGLAASVLETATLNGLV